MIDAIIIADYQKGTFAAASSQRLKIGESLASIQTLANYIENDGKVEPPILGDKVMSWESTPKLNGLYLYNYLLKENFNARLINNYNEERDKFIDYLSYSPKSIIISTTFIHSKQILKSLIDDIRSLAPEAYIIVGGPFVYSSYLLKKKESDVDYDTDSPKIDFLFLEPEHDPDADIYIIHPRGIDILCDLLKNKINNKSSKQPPNTASFKNKNYTYSQFEEQVGLHPQEIDWSLFPEDIYKKGVMSYQASNGCPFNCLFCNFVKNKDLYFVREYDDIINDLKIISQNGVRYIYFVDDNFLFGQKDIDVFLKKMIDADLGIKWASFVSANVLKNVDLNLFKEAGLSEAYIGVESADLNLLKQMRKSNNPELYAEIIRNLQELGITCVCTFIIGFPGETEESINVTRDFIISIENPELPGVLLYNIFPFILAPLSPIYEKKYRDKFNLNGYMFNWEHSTMSSKDVLKQIYQVHLSLNNSGILYSSDNLEMMHQLSPMERKKLVINRNRMGKQTPDKDDIIKTFKPYIDSIFAKDKSH